MSSGYYVPCIINAGNFHLLPDPTNKQGSSDVATGTSDAQGNSRSAVVCISLGMYGTSGMS